MPPAVSRGSGSREYQDAYPISDFVTEEVLDLLAQMRVVDHQIDEAGGAQSFNLPHDQGLAASHQQRLRGVVGERTHAFAEPGRQNRRGSWPPLEG
jgi:hypothetical protein